MLLKSFVQETLKSKYQRCNKDDCDAMMKMSGLNDIECNCRTPLRSVASQAYAMQYRLFKPYGNT